MKNLESPRNFQFQLENDTTFCVGIGDGDNIGGDVNDNVEFTIFVNQWEEGEEYEVELKYEGDDEEYEDIFFEQTCNSYEEVVEAIKELETIVPKK
jgi:hypothetical protein